MDFTLDKYKELLQALKEGGYSFLTFADYIRGKDEGGSCQGRTVVLRHDVDKRPHNSLDFALLENDMGAVASYYFRVVECSWDENIVREIFSLGHEIGYHYECMDTCSGDLELAFEDFKTNLEKMRQTVPVETVCMHGSPRTRFDNRDLWERYSYRDFGIIGEPYLDVDYSSILYLTDTGRRWDGYKVSVRDKIPDYQEEWLKLGWSFHNTDDIIDALRKGGLPDAIMITTHPQRWSNSFGLWLKELLSQSIKNAVKRMLIAGK